MADDEPGLLGNLPRSRPGTRSDKRSAAKPGAKHATGTRKASAKSAPASSAAASKGGPKAKPVPVTVAEPETPHDQRKHEKAGPLSSAAKVAGTGLRVAEGVTRGVLKRLPRP